MREIEYYASGASVVRDGCSTSGSVSEYLSMVPVLERYIRACDDVRGLASWENSLKDME